MSVAIPASAPRAVVHAGSPQAGGDERGVGVAAVWGHGQLVVRESPSSFSSTLTGISIRCVLGGLATWEFNVKCMSKVRCVLTDHVHELTCVFTDHVHKGCLHN